MFVQCRTYKSKIYICVFKTRRDQRILCLMWLRRSICGQLVRNVFPRVLWRPRYRCKAGRKWLKIIPHSEVLSTTICAAASDVRVSDRDYVAFRTICFSFSFSMAKTVFSRGLNKGATICMPIRVLHPGHIFETLIQPSLSVCSIIPRI